MILSIKSQTGNESDIDEKSLSEIKAVLVSNSTLLNGKAKMREKQCATYDMSVLNTSVEADKIVKMILNAKRFSEKNKSTENGVRMLFTEQVATFFFLTRLILLWPTEKEQVNLGNAAR